LTGEPLGRPERLDPAHVGGPGPHPAGWGAGEAACGRAFGGV